MDKMELKAEELEAIREKEIEKGKKLFELYAQNIDLNLSPIQREADAKALEELRASREKRMREIYGEKFIAYKE